LEPGEGQTLCNVLENDANVMRLGLDDYLGRDLGPGELEAAMAAANAAGAAFRQLPAGGGMYRLVVDHAPAWANADDLALGL
jgi:hypothetical protein